MRLSIKEKDCILKTAELVFGAQSSVYLFGSRTDDNKRGGDIDLYIATQSELDDKLNKKIMFLVKLKNQLGDQKIDLVISGSPHRLIDKIALAEGIKL